MENSKVICFIFARGGSKAIPNKNLSLLGGMPLLAHSINMAKSIPDISDVLLSTDSVRIANVGQKFGVSVPFMRPENLSLDGSSELLAWKHAVDFSLKNNIATEDDIFLSLPPTAPLRSSSDVQGVIALSTKEGVDIVITGSDAARHPAFNMLKKNVKGYVELMDGHKDYIRRQDVPKAYDMTTVAYAARFSYIKHCDTIFSGNVALFEVPRERSIDIDTIFDLKVAQLLLDSSLSITT